MNSKVTYDELTRSISKKTTRHYSTSFSMGINLLHKRFHDPIYSIYGMVRFADEIVDTFHDYDKASLLDEFTRECYEAMERGISLNPILNSFQEVVNIYSIEKELIDSFFKSMEMDLQLTSCDIDTYNDYILGSAEVVGLMCLRVFCEGDESKYQSLKHPAMKLGSAFQKINFLRDIKADYEGLGRAYFPKMDFKKFTEGQKMEIEKDIEQDFNTGLEGIKKLPKGAQLGVYTAYIYYRKLFNKIKSKGPEAILMGRIRIPNWRKLLLTLRCCVDAHLGII